VLLNEDPDKIARAQSNFSESPIAAMSIDVEDWFQTENLRSVCPRETWHKLDPRVERNTMRMLEILSDRGTAATFFVLGWVAERYPRLVRAIASAGHEIASHGYHHELVYALNPEAFRADVLRSKALLEDIGQVEVRGYRAPSFSITEWAIPILRDAGYAYDSSMVATLFHDRYGSIKGIDVRKPIVRLYDDFHEVCVSCLPVGTRGIPWGGGGYFRIVPYALWLRGVRAIQGMGLPYIFYIHPWEIDPGQPRPKALKASSKFRQFVNLGRCEERFSSMLGSFEWLTVGSLLHRWLSSQPSMPILAASTAKQDRKPQAKSAAPGAIRRANQ